MQCPLCGSAEFRAYMNRPTAICTGCGALERHRLLWLVLTRSGVLFEDMRVLHLAPEPALARKFSALSPKHYHPADLVPKRWNIGQPIFPLDCCTDLAKLPSGCFDLIVHLHVLEHLPCALDAVLDQFTRILTPRGHHFFAVPFRGPTTVEDLSDLTREQRTASFGQHDHMRVFGTQQFPKELRARWGADPVVDIPAMITKAEFEAAGMPLAGYGKISGNTIFHQVGGVRAPAKAAVPAPAFA